MTSEKAVLDGLEVMLEELHRFQVARAKQFAHRTRPDLTDEDLLNPDNFPEIMSDPGFIYEDGIAAGILAAKIAVRRHLITPKS